MNFKFHMAVGELLCSSQESSYGVGSAEGLNYGG